MANKDKEPYKSWKKSDPTIDQYKVCDECKGMGDVMDKQTTEFHRCDKCKGTGTVKK